MCLVALPIFLPLSLPHYSSFFFKTCSGDFNIKDYNSKSINRMAALKIIQFFKH